MLREFAARLRRSVRETDVVARLAGEEFVVRLEGLAADQDASIAGDGSNPPPTASERMMCADKALCEAKREGRDGFRLSDFSDVPIAA